MGFDRCLIGVTLHEHIGIRHFTVVELIQQAALLVFVDLIDELSRDLLEFRALALLDLDRCDNSKHSHLSLFRTPEPTDFLKGRWRSFADYALRFCECRLVFGVRSGWRAENALTIRRFPF